MVALLKMEERSLHFGTAQTAVPSGRDDRWRGDDQETGPKTRAALRACWRAIKKAGFACNRVTLL